MLIVAKIYRNLAILVLIVIECEVACSMLC